MKIVIIGIRLIKGVNVMDKAIEFANGPWGTALMLGLIILLILTISLKRFLEERREKNRKINRANKKNKKGKK